MASTESKPDPPTEEQKSNDASDAPTAAKDDTTYTGMATSAATSAAGTASNAAVGVKDSVFSMFGGGAKKEKKEDVETGEEDRSGSAKAKKDAEAADKDEGEEHVCSRLAIPQIYVLQVYKRNPEGKASIMLMYLAYHVGRWRARLARSTL